MKMFFKILGTGAASMPIINREPFVVFFEEDRQFILVSFSVEPLMCDGGITVKMWAQLPTYSLGQFGQLLRWLV